MKSHTRFLTSLLLVLFAAIPATRAAESRVFETAETTAPVQTNVKIPADTAAVIEDVGDLRPLSSKPFMSRLHINAQTNGEFVSNAKLEGEHGSGDFLFLPTVTASFNQDLEQGFSLDMIVRAEAFIYSRFSNLSFWGFSGRAALDYQRTPAWPTFYVGVEPYWYASLHGGDELADAIGITAGVERTYVFNRDKTALFAGYNFTSYFASPGLDDRDAHRVTVGVTHQLRTAWYAQVYYTYQFSDYRTIDRSDSRHIFGAKLVHDFNVHWTGSVYTYFADNNSSQRLASYQTVGVGAGLNYRF
jgi:hypothetical protein